MTRVVGVPKSAFFASLNILPKMSACHLNASHLVGKATNM